MVGLLPRVGLILTGGTIDSVGTDRLDLAWYIEANKRLGDGELLAQQARFVQVEQRGDELAMRQVARGAEDDHDARRRRPVLRGLRWKVSSSTGNPRAEVTWSPNEIDPRVRPLFRYLVRRVYRCGRDGRMLSNEGASRAEAVS